MQADLQQIISGSNNIVFFGGAGVSTESGIPDYRSVDGLYHQQYQYPPERMLSHSFFLSHTAEFYQFYRNKMIYLDAEPNPAHQTLARLEQAGKLKAVITQNIDGLHQKAGSVTVLELHGSIHRNYCARCRRDYPISAILESGGVPHCDCGGVIRPDVVLYEESLDDDVLARATDYISGADVLMIGGTSLAVYPAAALLRYYRGGKLVLINKDPTPMDSRANLVLHAPLGQVMRELHI